MKEDRTGSPTARPERSPAGAVAGAAAFMTIDRLAARHSGTPPSAEIELPDRALRLSRVTGAA